MEKLRNADMRDRAIKDTELTGVGTGALLDHSLLECCRVHLIGAVGAREATFDGCRIGGGDGSDLEECHFIRCTSEECEWRHLNLRRCIVQDCRLDCCDFVRCHFTSTDFRECRLKDTGFTGCILRRCRFEGGAAERLSFEHCTLVDCTLPVGAELKDCTVLAEG